MRTDHIDERVAELAGDGGALKLGIGTSCIARPCSTAAPCTVSIANPSPRHKTRPHPSLE
jgi:hypothetical protein